MGSGNVRSLRALPRFFGPKRAIAPGQSFDLEKEELNRLRNVLRLRSEEPFGLMFGDGILHVSRLDGNQGLCEESVPIDNEPSVHLTLALAFSKPEAMESAIQMGTEIGVSEFRIFPTERSVVRWDDKKLALKMERFRTIIAEAAAVSFRTRLPGIQAVSSLERLIEDLPEIQFASERDEVTQRLQRSQAMQVAIGPEGGWAPREVDLIGDRAFTLGTRVMRVATAAAAVASLCIGDR